MRTVELGSCRLLRNDTTALLKFTFTKALVYFTEVKAPLRSKHMKNNYANLTFNLRLAFA